MILVESSGSTFFIISVLKQMISNRPNHQSMDFGNLDFVHLRISLFAMIISLMCFSSNQVSIFILHMPSRVLLFNFRNFPENIAFLLASVLHAGASHPYFPELSCNTFVFHSPQPIVMEKSAETRLVFICCHYFHLGSKYIILKSLKQSFCFIKSLPSVFPPPPPSKQPYNNMPVLFPGPIHSSICHTLFSENNQCALFSLDKAPN